MTDSNSADAMKDEAQIRWLIERYYVAIDAKDADLMRSCFTEDAKVVYHDGEGDREIRLGNRDEVLAYLTAGTAWNGPSIHALSSTHVRSTHGVMESTSFAVAYLDVKGKVLVRGLRYNDQFEKGPDGWRIRRRSHKAIWQFNGDSVPSMVPRR